jgi:seryl-tRNA synthetase
MLSLDFICQYPQVVREALRQRRDTRNIDEILRLAEQRRGLIARQEGLYASLKQVKGAERAASDEKRPTLKRQIKAIAQDIRQIELQSSDVDTRLQLQLLNLPNLPQKSVPEGDDRADNQEVRRWRETGSFYFEPQSHWDLAERLGIIDVASGVRVAGSRFVTLKGMGARLERALISFMLDIHTREHGYMEVMPPHLIRRSVMIGAGNLPRFEEQAYACSADELFLNPATEVPLVGLHSDSILYREELPLRYVAWTTAFRRDAGSTSHHNRGLLSLHQFNQVELFQLVVPEEANETFERMIFHAERILRLLELPYRVMVICSGKLPFAAARSIELEVWMPGTESYVEVSSISNCEAFQARRASIKFRPRNDGRAEYVHTLHASGLAVSRTMAAILEIYQQADGSVIIPKVLRPYVGASQLSPSHMDGK